MHLIDLPSGFLGAVPIVGSTIPMAVGAAMGSTMRGEDRVTAVFLGEGATEEGVFHESLNFAVLKSLPVIFICENNFFSVYSPLSVRQPPGREIYRLAQGHGIESHQGDGNDVMEVYRLTHRAVSKARAGGGPTFLEFSTYRWREHCGPSYDNHLGYRAECDFLEWRGKCPLDRLKDRLLADGHLSLQEMEGMENQIKAEMAEAVAFAKQSPFPEADLLMKHVYAS